MIFPSLVAENSKLKAASQARGRGQARYSKKIKKVKKLRHALHVTAQIKVASLFFNSELQIVNYFFQCIYGRLHRINGRDRIFM